MSLTITDLKKHLGPGLGLRKNRYRLEIAFENGYVLNLLCRSAGLPERNINTTIVWHKGRKYNVRGETDYGNEYEISIVDDSEMAFRKIFDAWLKIVDNSKPIEARGSFSSYEDSSTDPSANSGDLINEYSKFFTSGKGANYQLDINIWQLDNSDGNVYGYKLENAFPKSIGIVTLDDSDADTLSEFSINFEYSEFIPIYGKAGDNIDLENYGINTQVI